MKMLFGLLLLATKVFADSPQNLHSETRQTFFAGLSSPFMEVIEKGSPYYNEDLGEYPLLAQLVQLDIFKWDPSGKGKRNIAPCDPKAWQKKVLQKSHPQSQWTSELEDFLKACHTEWETGWNGLISNSIGMMSFKLHPNRYPYGRHVMFHLPNGIELKGLLAMKTDQKKRPLVIFRTGLFSNTQEFYPERSLFFQLFEQSPFNVLVIESSSGSEFLKHNKSYALGGFDEGLQNFLLAQRLRDPKEPLSEYIESIHLVGSSLGGHGVIFSSLLSELNPDALGKPVVQSALAFCPLLNMQDTLDYHLSQGFSMDLMNYWASRRLVSLKEQIPDLKNETFIPQFFDWIKKNYKGPLIAENGKVQGVRLPPEAEALINSAESSPDLFWKLNHFWPWYHQVRTPVLIFSTRKDPIVSWFINSGRIEDQRMKFEDSNLKMFSFDQGYHCSLPIAYDWKVLTTLFQTYILKLSPDFQMQKKQVRIPLPEKVPPGGTPYLDVDFEVSEMTAGVLAKVRFDSELWPTLSERWMAPTMTAQLALSEMEFPIDQVVQNTDEASLLTRWAYQNIEAHVEGRDLVFSWWVSR